MILIEKADQLEKLEEVQENLEAKIPSKETLDALAEEKMTELKAELEKVKEAIGCGIKATTLQPNDLLAWTGLSQMYVRDGQIAEAEHAKGNARILSMGGKVSNLS